MRPRATTLTDGGHDGTVQHPLKICACRATLRRAVVVLMLVATAVLLGSGCGGSAAKVQVKQLRYGVRLSARMFPAQAVHVRHVRPAKLPARHVLRLSATYRLTHVQRLPATLTVRFRLSRPLPKGYVLSGATREEGASWVPLPVRASANGRYATVYVHKLSDFIFFGINVSQALRTVKQNVVDGLLAGATSEASPPRCDSESQARENGFSIASDSGSAVYWCLGVENGKRVLKVVNNRRYTLDLNHPGLTVISPGSFHLELASLARAGSGNATVLAPRDQATFGVGLKPGKSGGISTNYDGLAQSLFQLQFGVQTALAVLTSLGSAGKATMLGAMQKLLSATGCASALGGSAGDVLAKCFSPSQIIKAFGFKGLFIAPLMVAGPFVNFFRSEFNSIGDQLNGRSHYRIAIHNTSKPTPPTTTLHAEPTPAQTVPATTSESSAPTSTREAPTTSSYGVGAQFYDLCHRSFQSPQRTSTESDFMMSCVHAEAAGFLFTEMIVPNPTFQLGDGGVYVTGKVIDIAVADVGYKQLVVEATNVQPYGKSP